ncbi:iron-sulfur cluster assembly protein [Pyrococcus abyssi]|uniref:MIP18 family-like domain-containing protein n=1 Tax=Pyrococcus abyssi (strain GE5 / Orsay) TaxID=272844 RepID=Q9UYU7_PYRAB|nr:iron-sulfur cluster assembly protein [Pyrococcus abyssi]CAB50315.1 Hypothetical protein PAB1442 [Pyrococcus abyssi GE5]CCE70854.1 TPA: hypothetical protein PAB1442 [Pyrococcus abyssi GE5]
MKVYYPGRKWPREYEEVLNELKNVIDPVTGESILDSGILAGLEVSGRTLKVWLKFESLAEYNILGGAAMAYSKIAGDIIERLALTKFDNVYVYDLRGNPVGVFESRGKKHE